MPATTKGTKTAKTSASAKAPTTVPSEGENLAENTLSATDTAIRAIVPEDSEFGRLLAECNNSAEDALFKFCFLHDVCYSRAIARRTLIRALEAASEDGAEVPDIPALYQAEVTADSGFTGRDFFSQLKRENFERIYEE